MPALKVWRETQYLGLVSMKYANSGFRAYRAVYLALCHRTKWPVLPPVPSSMWVAAMCLCTALYSAEIFGVVFLSCIMVGAFGIVSVVRFSDSVAMLTKHPEPELHVGKGICCSINVGCGMPKVSVERALVTQMGIPGDVQRHGYIEHWGGHGGALKAVMLWSSDVIEKVQADGHAITAGMCGEQITLAGVDWSLIRSGVQITIANVLLEITFLKAPCNSQTDNFAATCCADHTTGGSNRIDPSYHPNECRALARVLRPGWIRTGDEVCVFKARRANRELTQGKNEKGVYFSTSYAKEFSSI